MFVCILISLENRAFDRIRGFNDFAIEISETIKDKSLVVSDRIVFSNISYAMRKKPNLIFMPYKNKSPITNHFQMVSPLDHNEKRDLFLVGNLSDISYLSNEHEGKLIKQFNVPFSSSEILLYEINFK